MLERVLETEAMDTSHQGRDYDAMDHAEVNQRFVAALDFAPRTAAATTGRHWTRSACEPGVAA